MVLLINRIVSRIARGFRKSFFKKSIKCEHNQFTLVGNITLINKNISLGKNVTIYPNCMFYGDGPIIIGNNCEIGNNVIIYSSKNGGVYIADNVMIAANSYITDCDHGTQKNVIMRNQKTVVSSVRIGNDVWIGTGVIVLKGSQINDGAIIGAGALVRSTVESNAIAIGIPAKIVKYRQNG